jgi:hypothetical protein
MCPHSTLTLSDIPGFIVCRAVTGTLRMVTYLRGPSEGFSLSIQDAAVYLGRETADLIANQFEGAFAVEIGEAFGRQMKAAG